MVCRGQEQLKEQQNRCCISSRIEIFKIERFNNHEVFENLIVITFYTGTMVKIN